MDNATGYEKERIGFNSLKGRSLKSLAQEQISNYIIESNLKEGEMLPTEKFLSEQIGLSRTVIRETLNRLESLGIIEARHGVGRFLKRFDFQAIVDNMPHSLLPDHKSFRDLLEVRVTLEVTFLSRDITRIIPGDIKELQKKLDEMHTLIQAGSEEDALIRSHAEFHRRLFKSSDNTLLIDLINMFATVQSKLSALHEYATKDRERFLLIHQKLLNEIESQNINRVRQCLIDHYAEPVAWVRSLGIDIEIPNLNI